MLKRTVLSLIFVGLAFLGAGFIAGELGAFAREDQQCDDQATDSPFMGMADPAAPYDLRFIDEMVMHHQGAIISSEMMIADSERPELRDLARRIQESQQHEIDQMLDWRDQWYPDADPPAMVVDMDGMAGMMDLGPDAGMMRGGMMGGMMMGMMRMLGMMDGDHADRMFLRMMIPHHQLAIDMAEHALVHAEHEELKGLAREIIAGQSAEITEMEEYLLDWYGEASTRDVAGAMRDMMSGVMRGC